jgi:hypothetical protein
MATVGSKIILRKYILIAFAVTSTPAIAQEVSAHGKIVMYRPGSIVGSAVACPIRYEGREVVELGRNKYAEWIVAPGRYILMNKTAGLEVNVEPGETRYVRCAIKAGLMSGRADLQMSDEVSFREKFHEFERKEINLTAAP